MPRFVLIGAMQRAVLFAWTVCWAMPACAGILFDTERDAIRITDYPPAWPCSLRQLAVADRAFGWGKVRYDETAAVCYVEGDLLIGDNDGSETVLQVSAPDCPRETLVMRGNIYVHPYFIHEQNTGLYWRVEKRINALRLGLPGATNLSAKLIFACASNEHYTINCGRLPWIKAEQFGGGLYVYHGEISARDPAWPIGDAQNGFLVCCGSTVFDGARIADVKKFIYGMTAGHNKDYLVRNTVFERVGVPLLNGAQQASGCVFRNCGTAVMDYGSLKAELTDCVFENNDRNWSLNMSDDGLVLVDCVWNAPRLGDLYGTREFKGKTNRPKLSVRRHVVVEVRDASGKPVEGAAVSFRAEQDGCDLIQNRVFKTDAQGRTPGAGAEDAMLLTEYIETAVKDSEQPERAAFTYVIAVEYKGRQAAVKGISPDANWKTFTVGFGE